ncbi:MAG TPA: uroporphyrinogen-III C-methyltransferase [Kofleriaceae bacterium]|nr:uroporphyrinogen-III C-methyltransferase [Kofleriaceae bacterium]
MKSGKAYLIGAGPGDPKLLTLRAAEVLRQADVVLVDDLVHPDVLSHARTARIIRVGKRSQRRAFPQELATNILIAYVRGGAIVARVKGGDPMLFGRGGEEALALAEAGLPFEIVPGVTAALGAAAYAGIPLTHRGTASSVAFVAGHREGDQPARLDVEADTIVVYMCQRTIHAIARELIAAGRSPMTCIALVRGASWQSQELYTGYLGEAAALEDDWYAVLDPEPPTVAIIGAVASYADQMQWFGRRATPLAMLMASPLRYAAGGR